MGQIKFSENGIIRIPIVALDEVVYIDYPVSDITSGNWENFLNSTTPYCAKDISNPPKLSVWIFKGKCVKVENQIHESDEEVKLNVMNIVFRHEKKYENMRRQVDAYNNFEKILESKREKISESVRLYVWQRDEGKCIKCGSTEKLEFDHIIPVAKGGSNTERNIQLLCENCNRQKGANI